MPPMKILKDIKLILIIFLLCTACAKKNIELNQDKQSNVPNFGAISNVLACMFAPNSEDCKRAKELNQE